MFLSVTTTVATPVDEAVQRLTDLLRRDGMSAISSSAFGDGERLMVRAGLRGMSKQVQVFALAPYHRDDDVVVIAFSWHATGPFGEMFPVLDANLELVASEADKTAMTLVGSYRPPAGRLGETLDRVLLHQVAEATARGFLHRVGEAIGSDSLRTAS